MLRAPLSLQLSTQQSRGKQSMLRFRPGILVMQVAILEDRLRDYPCQSFTTSIDFTQSCQAFP